MNFAERLSVVMKYCLSFSKTDWDIDDYPIRVRHLPHETSEQFGRLKPVAWSAQVINWWAMSGHGDSLEEATSALRDAFAARKAQGLAIPRPGRGLPIEFAPGHRIAEHPDLARDFFSRILELNYDECFISDSPSLWDFHVEDDNSHLNEKILLTYGVDVSDIGSGNLADIFTRLVSRGISAT